MRAVDINIKIIVDETIDHNRRSGKFDRLSHILVFLMSYKNLVEGC